jgi:hypothetical protein
VALRVLASEFGNESANGRQELALPDAVALLRAIALPWIAAQLEWAGYNAWDLDFLRELDAEIQATLSTATHER